MNRIKEINNRIESLTKEINESIKYDRLMMESQWSKGVMTKFQMRSFGENYISNNTKKLLRERTRQFKRRNELAKKAMEESE